MSLLQTKKDNMSPQSFMFKCSSERIKMPLGIPVDQATWPGLNSIFTVHFGQIREAVFYLPITHIGQDRNDSQIVCVHHPGKFTFRQYGCSISAISVNMNIA